MKKLHILGYSYTFNDDAYDTLNTYLNDIKAKFVGKHRIIIAIENQVLDKLDSLFARKKKTAITPVDIDDLIQTIGSPEHLHKNIAKLYDDEHKPESQYIRDYENRVLGGICAMFANKLKISPWIVRIIALFLAYCLANLNDKSTIAQPVWLYIGIWLYVQPAISREELLKIPLLSDPNLILKITAGIFSIMTTGFLIGLFLHMLGVIS